MKVQELYNSKAINKADLELPEIKDIKKKYIYGTYNEDDALDQLITYIPELRANSVIEDWKEEQSMLWERFKIIYNKSKLEESDKRDYPKREIIVDGKYVSTTTWAKDNKEAISRWIEIHPEDKDKKVIAREIKRR